MPNFSSSKRFAQAIYAIAKETDTVSDWVKNLESINDILSEKDLVATLNSPNKPIALKCSILDKIYGKSLDRLVLNLLYLLSTRNSIDLISGIKSIRSNFKFNIKKNELQKLPEDNSYKLYISSLLKSCGYKDIDSTYKCSFYKPLISENLIN